MTTKPTTSDMSLQELLLEYRSAIANLLQDHHSHGVTTAQLTAIDKRYLAAIEAHYAAKEEAATNWNNLLKLIDASGNEFAMGYDDSGCFWKFYYGQRGKGSMMFGQDFWHEGELDEALKLALAERLNNTEEV